VVARVVERLHALPRWCVGLRRVRHPVPDQLPAADVPGADGCVFTYEGADARFTLRARTVAAAPGEPADTVHHEAVGDGVTLVWSYTADAESGDGGGAPAAGARTRLRARTTVSVDPEHPAAALRPALCRQVARRAPADLERLRALLERYEFGKRHGRRQPAAAVAPERAAE
jgi:hypothetical protein